MQAPSKARSISAAPAIRRLRASPLASTVVKALRETANNVAGVHADVDHRVHFPISAVQVEIDLGIGALVEPLFGRQ